MFSIKNKNVEFTDIATRKKKENEIGFNYIFNYLKNILIPLGIARNYASGCLSNYLILNIMFLFLEILTLENVSF